MSYHNGSVWPHDNALIGLGLARYGLCAEAARVLEGMAAAAGRLDLRRLPELFCGFPRRGGQSPTAIPSPAPRRPGRRRRPSACSALASA
jgi:glycogen debranching enzyme